MKRFVGSGSGIWCQVLSSESLIQFASQTDCARTSCYTYSLSRFIGELSRQCCVRRSTVQSTRLCDIGQFQKAGCDITALQPGASIAACVPSGPRCNLEMKAGLSRRSARSRTSCYLLSTQLSREICQPEVPASHYLGSFLRWRCLLKHWTKCDDQVNV